METMQVSHVSDSDTASTRPSGRTVAVGYQRAWFIGAIRVHSFVTGSNISVLRTPIPQSACPPIARTRPSASTTAALQNILVRLFGIAVNVPVAGFQS